MRSIKSLLTLFILCSHTLSYAKTTLMIACSSNFVPVLEQVAKRYEEKTKLKIIIVQGSSGKLTTQLINGLPADIFLSANKTYTTQLIERKKGGSSFPYAIGELMLVVKNRKANEHIIRYLNHHQDLIGIANPALAPYGQQAMRFLESIDLWDKLKDQLVYGQNINQTFQQLITGNLNAAFISRSQWIHYLRGNSKGAHSFYAYHVPAPLNRIVQHGMLLTHSEDHKIAQDFIRFLLHDIKANELIRTLGYQPIKS